MHNKTRYLTHLKTHNMRTKNRFALIFLVLIPLFSFAQKRPIKFGKVPKSDLEMTVYDNDSSAAAVVLCDYGYWDANDGMFRRVYRIKILTKEGLDYANFIYPSLNEVTLRGKTSTLENGEIVVEKLRHENIFKERLVDDYWRTRITFPNVKVGSVIDVEMSHFLPPMVWYFQREIPVRWSELIIPSSHLIDYRKNWYGYESLTISTDSRWASQDVPAFVSEPYMNSKENYMSKYEIEILIISFPDLYRELSTDWNAVARRLEESGYFGGVLNSALYLTKAVSSIEEKTDDPLEKLKLAYDEAKKIKWNKFLSNYPSSASLGFIYKEGTGNSADINMILVNLLRKLDISSYPVVMSTRKNGLLPPLYPSRYRLNNTIAYAKIGDEEYLLDATEENVPVGLLPERCLNKNAQIIFDDIRKAKHVELKPNGKHEVTKMITLDLLEDLTLTGSVSTLKKDYAALNFRNYYKDFSSEEDMLIDFTDDNPGLKVKNYSVDNMNDIYQPIKESYEVNIQNQVYEIDNQLFISPLLHLKTKENPFKLEKRTYPVDFPYLYSKSYVVKINIPEGYEVSEIPEPLAMALPENAGRIIYRIAYMNNQLMVTYRFSINKEMFLPTEYVYLREFYNQIIKKQAEPVILNKL